MSLTKIYAILGLQRRENLVKPMILPLKNLHVVDDLCLKTLKKAQASIYKKFLHTVTLSDEVKLSTEGLGLKNHL